MLEFRSDPATFLNKAAEFPLESLPPGLTDFVKQKNDATSVSDDLIGPLTEAINSFVKVEQDKAADKTTASANVYSRRTLEVYDLMVWDFNSPFHWRTDIKQIEKLYQECLAGTSRHCEVAVGTGLFLRNWVSPNDTVVENLTLMDLSESALEKCHRFLEENEEANGKKFATVTRVKSDILQLDDPEREAINQTFDSIAANFLLHCLPGKSMGDKATCIQSCANLLNPNGIFFGSTILGKDLIDDAEQAGPHAVETNRLYNELGVFGNAGDTYRDLSGILHENFGDVEIWRDGYCAVWKARRPKHV